jgi:hypothetical protein
MSMLLRVQWHINYTSDTVPFFENQNWLAQYCALAVLIHTSQGTDITLHRMLYSDKLYDVHR